MRLVEEIDWKKETWKPNPDDSVLYFLMFPFLFSLYATLSVIERIVEW